MLRLSYPIRFIIVLLVAVLALGLFSDARAQGGGTYSGVYIVQPGDTLFSIAQRFNVSISELATINGIYDVNHVFTGQVLRLPPPLPGSTQPQQPSYPQPVTYPYYPPQPIYPPGTTITTVTTYRGYVVRRGDTLSAIAVRFRTTIQAILSANPLMNPNYIYVGQFLNIPRTTTTIVPAPRPPRPIYRRVYIVQPGDTLFGIAHRFRRDVYAIAKANGLLNLNAIYVGQALNIP